MIHAIASAAIKATCSKTRDGGSFSATNVPFGLGFVYGPYPAVG